MSRLIISEHGSDNQWTTECTAEVTIGRHPGSDVVLSAPGISRQHAVIIRDGEEHFIIDKNSGNGTSLNNRKLKPDMKYPLRPGDIINIESFELRYHVEENKFQEVMNEENTDSNVFEVRLLKKVLSAIDQDSMPSIEVLSGASIGKKVYLPEGQNEIFIGRDQDCTLILQDASISRHHAKIMRRWGGITIRDLDSKNGVFINNRRIVEESLHDGDRLALGDIVLMFRNPQEISVETWEELKPKNPVMDIKAEDIPITEDEEEEKDKAEEEFEDLSEELEIPKDAIEEFAEEPSPDITPGPYPIPPHLKKAKLSPIEIGMMGLGALVILVSLITIANLLFD